jgi:hypothetical protein
MDKTQLGFELLLGHYLATRKRSNVYYHEEFFSRFGELLWRRWLIETDILREQMLDSIFEWKGIFADINTDDVDILSLNLDRAFETLSGNNDLAWLVNSTKDAEALKRDFDPERFTRLYKGLHVNPYPHTDGAETPLVYLTKLKDGKYEELFDIDLQRGFGSSTTQTCLSHKSTQLFVSYLYAEGRKTTVSQLKDFILKAP